MVNNNSRRRARQVLDALRVRARDASNRVGEAVTMARVGTDVALRTGLAYELGPKAALKAIELRLRGGLGLAGLFAIHAAAVPDKLALVDDERRLTYAEVDRRIGRLATRLSRDHGIGPHKAVLIALHNRVELLEAQAAAARIGASAVNASWRSTSSELEYLLSHSGATVALVEPEGIEATRAAIERQKLPVRALVHVGGGPSSSGSVSYDSLVDHGGIDLESASGEDGAVVVYTSGTTGKPKGAVRKFGRDAHLTYLQMLSEIPVRSDDQHLVVCPLYHTTAFGFAMMTLLVAGTIHIARKFDAEAVLKRIDAEGITTSAMVPTMLHRLLELPAPVRARHSTRSLRAVLSGGAPLSGTLARSFMESYGHVLYNFYGATETGLNTFATPDELLRSPGTIGHVAAGNEIRMLDEAGNIVAPGKVGELFVKNAALVSYHRDEAATNAASREGFFSVGDLAHFDASGLVHLDGRKRDMIISGGVNVYPAEVEELLATHPSVADVAVIGVPDPDLGERVRAYVELKEGAKPRDEKATIAELLAFAKERLSGAKVPREVRLVDELPKNPTGKVLKRELRALEG
jgi:fatty-acyl-CoA synthase